MHEFQTTVNIDCPLEKTFADFLNEKNLMSWLSGLKSVDLISGTPGEAGAKLVLELVLQGMNVRAEQEIISIKEKEEIVYTLDSEYLRVDSTVLFSEKEGKTEIYATASMELKGAMMQMLAAMINEKIEEKQVNDFENFKNYMEGNEVDLERFN